MLNKVGPENIRGARKLARIPWLSKQNVYMGEKIMVPVSWPEHPGYKKKLKKCISDKETRKKM